MGVAKHFAACANLPPKLSVVLLMSVCKEFVCTNATCSVFSSFTDAVAFSAAHFGAGIGSTFLDGVSCGGNEDSLIDCTRASSVICSNGHNEDAGVRCQIEGLLLYCQIINKKDV